MLAAVFYGAGDVRVEEVPEPRPGPGELLLEVHAVGICGTDADEFARGPTMFPVAARHPVTGHLGPLVPGHELSGRVVALGEGVAGFTVGEVVASTGSAWCGTCRFCRGGRVNLCSRYWTAGLHGNGGLAQRCAVPAMSCHPVAPYGLGEDAAALAQPMAIAVHAVGRGRLAAGERALIIGAGGVGAFATWVAAQAGADVTVCDLDPARLAVARALGAGRAVAATRDAPLASLLREALPEPPDVVYEITGSEQGIAAAFAVVAKGGRVVAVGLQHRPYPLELRQLTLIELELIGTNAMVAPSDLPEALRLLAARGDWSDVAPVALSLDRLVPDGLAPLAEGRAGRIKTLVDPWAAATRPTRW